MSTGFRVSGKVSKILHSTNWLHCHFTENCHKNPSLEKCNTFMSTITKEFHKKQNPQYIAQYETLIKYNKQNKQKSLQCGNNIFSMTGQNFPTIRTILEKSAAPWWLFWLSSFYSACPASVHCRRFSSVDPDPEMTFCKSQCTHRSYYNSLSFLNRLLQRCGQQYDCRHRYFTEHN